jgi:hypothetical protein
MKLTKIILLVVAIVFTQLAQAQKKVGIINFTISGKDRQMGTGSSNEPAPELYFIGPNSARLKPEERTSDAMVRLAEQKLAEYLNCEIIPTNLERASTIPDEMNGSLWAMETISEKTAFNKLNYDEAITVSVRIFLNSRSGKGYKATIEISYKLIGKDGKTISKKSEKLKIDEFIEPKLVEEQIDDSPITLKSIKDAVKGGSGNAQERKGSEAGGGLPADKVYDYFQQCLNNLIIDTKKK